MQKKIFQILKRNFLGFFLVIFSLMEADASPFQIETGSNNWIPVCQYIARENSFVRIPGQVAGSLIFVPSAVVTIPVLFSLVFVPESDLGIRVFEAVWVPSIVVGTVVSTPFYLVKKGLLDFPRKIIFGENFPG